MRLKPLYLVKQDEGMLKVFLKPKGCPDGTWVDYSNFRVSITHHSVNDYKVMPKYYICTCIVKGTEQLFYVTVSISDCAKHSKIEAKFSEAMDCSNGFINMDIRQTKLNLFIMKLLKAYDNEPNEAKREAVVFNSLGYHTILTNRGEKTIYIVGRNQLLPVSKKVKVETLSLFPQNPGLTDLCVSSHRLSDSAQGFVNCEIAYHGKNAGSILALHGYSRLAMNRGGMEEHMLKLGAIALFGLGETGKSSAADHLAMTFPRMNNSKMEVRENSTLTVPLLASEVSQSRAPVIQDPPTKKCKGLNNFLDQMYQNSLPKTTQSKHTCDKPQTGLLLVFPNEHVKLKELDVTTLTKVVFLYHQKNTVDFKTRQDNILSLENSASSIFLTYLKPPKWENLLKLQVEKIEIYKEQLAEKFDIQSIDNPRILNNFSLVHASTLEWVKDSKFNLDADVDEVLTRYFVDICIPKLLEIIASKKTDTKPDCKEITQDEMIDLMGSKIEYMGLKDILNSITFLNRDGINQVAFNISFWRKDFIGLFTGTNSLQNCSFAKRVVFLHKDSKSFWYRRNVSEDVFGKTCRANAYLLPNENVPLNIWKNVVIKLQDILPDLDENDQTMNIKLCLDTNFRNQENTLGELNHNASIDAKI